MSYPAGVTDADIELHFGEALHENDPEHDEDDDMPDLRTQADVDYYFHGWEDER